MNILIVGSGGREHALAWKILQSPRLTQLYTTAAFAFDDKIIPAQLSELDQAGIVAFAREYKIDLVVIGGETPLAAGLSDALWAQGIPTFGPSQAAAQIEASKVFAKNFMARHNIPTARYATFTQLDDAIHHLDHINYPVVIKASGLAAGKGVFLPTTLAEAKIILQQLLQQQTLGQAGAEIVIEERLQGEEISLLAFSDGYTVKTMPLARDHKRLEDGDAGPNTGGMGAYAPAPLNCATTISELAQTILQPTIDGLRAENCPFVGVIYAGLMLTPQGPKVLEFNCRFGDPETQVLLPLLATDLVDIMQACLQQQLAQCDIHWHPKIAACVVLASEGYPTNAQIGRVISGLEDSCNHTVIFHAGTRLENGKTVTAGGRVLGITALADSLTQALQHIYDRIETISFTGMQYRKDIGVHKPIDHYAASGVDITAGNRTIELMTAAVRSTYGPEVLAGIGAFGGMFDASALKNMQRPVLVASTDGIGTKVHLAAQANRFHSLGFDIVNHSVNDILVQGAKPLFFLDYLAASKLDPEKMAAIVTGMADACREVGCALLGGETAEMPGVYQPNTFDVAGTIVGIVEREAALPRPTLAAGDVLLGIASSGPHTNGYSLLRKIFADVDLTTVFPELKISLADALLAPHRCYLPVLQTALQDPQQPIKGLVHITGGGFFENIPRVLPQGLSAKIQLNSWPVPPLFQLTQQRGNVPTEQMYRVFNMGIGMILITAPEHVTLVRSLLNEDAWLIGELVAGEKQVMFS